MGEACSPSPGENCSRWFLRTNMYSSAHQRSTVDRRRCKFAYWSSCQSISWWHSNSFIHSSFGRYSSLLQSAFFPTERVLDCLFLDIYVPTKAVNNPSLKLPVISWFYGGAYIFGGKDSFDPVLPFYDGTGLIEQSQGNVIFVASNYRVRISAQLVRQFGTADELS